VTAPPSNGNTPGSLGGLMSNLDSALAGCRSVLRDVEDLARSLRRQLDQDPAVEPVVRGELYRLAKAVRAGTDVILNRLDPLDLGGGKGRDAT
jgi:hypothetical protein